MFDTRIPIDYANLATLNKVRAVARKHGATVKVSRYAKDAYEGYVSLPYKWNRGRSEDDAIVAAIKAVLKPGST